MNWKLTFTEWIEIQPEHERSADGEEELRQRIVRGFHCRSEESLISTIQSKAFNDTELVCGAVWEIESSR